MNRNVKKSHWHVKKCQWYVKKLNFFLKKKKKHPANPATAICLHLPTTPIKKYF
jgi:hypothetical protein